MYPSTPAEHMPLDFDKVLQDELRLIATRRKAAHVQPSVPQTGSGKFGTDASQPADSDVRNDLVGLALSGGGVRSAAFNLGILQALYEKNTLNKVDYLSTVSGGGYVGSHASSLAMHPKASFRWEDPANGEADSDGNPGAPGHAPQANTQQAKRVRDPENPVDATLGAGELGLGAAAVSQIAQNCRYLASPSHFVNRQLIGAFCLNTATVTGLITLASLTAWAFRTMDSPYIIEWLDAAGVRGDIPRAMMPAMFLFAVWLLAWALSFFRNGYNATGRSAKVFLFLATFATALGLTSITALGDIGISPTTIDLRQLSTDANTEVTEWAGKIANALLLTIAGALLPYLNPKALLRSATTNRRGVSRLIYRIATCALLFGAPLAVFWHFSKEDISEHEQTHKEILHIPALNNLDQLDLAIAGGDGRKVSVKARQSLEGNSSEDVGRDSKEPSEHVSQNLKQLDLERGDFSYHSRYDINARSFRVPHKFWPAVIQAAGAALSQSENEPSFDRARIPHKLAEKLDHVRQIVERDLHLTPLQDELRYRELAAEVPLVTLIQGAVLHIISDDPDTRFRGQLARMERSSYGWEMVAQAISRKLLNDSHLSESIGLSTEIGVDEIKKEPWLERLKFQLATSEALAEELSRLDSLSRDLEQPVVDANLFLASMSEGRLTSEMWSRLHDLFGADRPLTAEIVIDRVLRADLQKASAAEMKKWQVDIRRLISLSEEIRASNRAILEELLVKDLAKAGTPFAYVVQPSDQEWRLKTAMVSGSICILLSLVISLNAISIRGIYRDSLSRAWVVDATPQNGQSLTLTELSANARRGFPYHIITGAMRLGFDSGLQGASHPFLLSALYCGSDATGFVSSSIYCNGKLTLPDAMSISGAAVAPPQIDDLLGRTLLTLANFRMGTWLPNPARASWLRDRSSLPALPRLLMYWWSIYPQTLARLCLQWGVWKWITPVTQRSHVYLSDGGHYENLGLEQLVKRRCRYIIVSDASQDECYDFPEFLHMAHRLSSEVEFIPHKEMVSPQAYHDSIGSRFFRDLIPDPESGFARKHFMVFDINYKAVESEVKPAKGVLIYIKPTLTDDEDPGLREFKRINPQFPHDPTSNQLFEDDTFEAYRRLGYHIGEEVCDSFRGLYGQSTEVISPADSPLPPMSVAAVPEVDSVRNDSVDISLQIMEQVAFVHDQATDPFARWYTVRELADLEDGTSPPLVDVLTELINDQDEDLALVSFRAAQALSSKNVLWVLAALSSRHPKVKLCGLKLLRQKSGKPLIWNESVLDRVLSLGMFPADREHSEVELRIAMKALQTVKTMPRRKLSDSLRTLVTEALQKIASDQSTPTLIRLEALTVLPLF